MGDVGEAEGCGEASVTGGPGEVSCRNSEVKL